MLPDRPDRTTEVRSAEPEDVDPGVDFRTATEAAVAHLLTRSILEIRWVRILGDDSKGLLRGRVEFRVRDSVPGLG